jgi:hypothetical protein
MHRQTPTGAAAAFDAFPLQLFNWHIVQGLLPLHLSANLSSDSPFVPSDSPFVQSLYLVVDCRQLKQRLYKVHHHHHYHYHYHYHHYHYHHLSCRIITRLCVKLSQEDSNGCWELQINSRYEFYDEIDLSQPDRQYIAADSETATDQKYKLLSVLVHAGANQGGHYNVYIRPDGKTWYKFDDEKVTKVDQSEAIEGQYGENAPVGGGGMFGRGEVQLQILLMLCLQLQVLAVGN